MIHTYQNPLSGEKVGIVFGTFAPLHQGHLDLIMRAKKECDGGCIVIVDGRDGDRGGKEMPLKLRYRYVREFFADDDLVAVYPVNETELGIKPYPNGWDKFITEVEKIFNSAADGSAVFYVSEDEKNRLVDTAVFFGDACWIHRCNPDISVGCEYFMYKSCV